MKRADRQPLSFRLYSFEANFLRMSLDEQFEFLDYFKSVLATKGEFERFVFGQLVNYLEKQMFKNFDSWLESEIEN